MASHYRVQIVNARGEVVWSTVPGMAAEVELIENLAARVRAKGVGVARTSAHVCADIRSAFAELLYDLKATIPAPRPGDVA